MQHSYLKQTSSLLFLFIFISLNGLCQTNAEKRQINSAFTSENIKIDGIIDESAWNKAEIGSDFIVFEPKPGIPSVFKTEFFTLYSNNAFYIAARLYDPQPDSIFREFTVRDDDNGNTDAFVFTLNPYNDGQHAYRFYVTTSNVQADIRMNGAEDDYSWNAVWESATQITENGWVAEVKVPFSMLRIPSTDKQTWGFNAVRIIRRNREASSWNPIYYEKGELTTQDGLLSGFENLNPPLRLSLYPYLSTYLEYSGESRSFGNSFNGGMDIKYGINESFTIDMTLVPDFGQTKSDNVVLNLTPYETYYNENRAFFNEGTELFNKAGIFYSRRIGKMPSGYPQAENLLLPGEQLVSNPQEAQLINAAKFSGRTATGLGIGIFNALTDNTYAKAENPDGQARKLLTEPLTNYSILVLDQSYRNNSYLNFTNTNVVRPGIDSVANVTSGILRWMDKKNVFGLYTQLALSHQSGAANIPQTGYLFNTTFGKFNGNYTYYYYLNVLSQQYNPNDLGYLSHNNSINHEINLSYRKYTPGKYFNSWRYSLNSELSQLFTQAKYINWRNTLNLSGTLKNYLSIGCQISAEPIGYHDYFETRASNRYVSMKAAYGANGWYSSDYRKKVALDFNGGVYWDADSLFIAYGTVAPRFRISDHWFLVPSVSVNHSSDVPGYLTHLNNETVYMGVRNEFSVEAVLTSSYVISNKASLSLNIRHLNSKVTYTGSFFLENDGSLTPYAGTDVSLDDENINFNAYNMDLLFSWNFLPGSYLNLSWKNFIYPSVDNQIHSPYWNNLTGTFRSPTNHSLSLKLIYFLDYGMIFR